jgi:hypothetical protein
MKFWRQRNLTPAFGDAPLLPLVAKFGGNERMRSLLALLTDATWPGLRR